MKPKLFLIVPVYNESKNVQSLVENILALKTELDGKFSLKAIFVDDCSSDNTGDLIRAASNDIIVLAHKTNLGPGAAFQTAFKFVANEIRPEDWLITMEGDNTSSLKTLKQMLIRRGEGYDVVLASVYSYGGSFNHVVRWRLTLSFVANLFIMTVLQIYGIRTLSSFFRLHSGRTIMELQKCYGPSIVELTGFGWAVEMLYKMIISGTSISEVETIVDWSIRRGTSKMRVVRTMREYLRIFFLHKKWKSQNNEFNGR